MKLPKNTNPDSFPLIILSTRQTINSIDLYNQRFGKLIVLKPISRNKDGRLVWLCKCSCGNYVSALGKTIKNGGTTSCGCFRTEQRAKQGTTAKDISNQVFNRLLALEPTKKRIAHSIIWKCVCSCGNAHEAAVSDLLANKVQSCGCLFTEITKNRFKQYRKLKGFPENEHMSTVYTHIHGILTPLTNLIYPRDKRQCALCNYTGPKLEVHHIVKKSTDLLLVANPFNLITLCKTCHREKAHKGNCAGSVDEQIAGYLLKLAYEREIKTPTNQKIVEKIKLKIKRYLETLHEANDVWPQGLGEERVVPILKE